MSAKCNYASWIGAVVMVACIAVATPRLFAASSTVRVGYPQPSGAMLPLWLVSEAKLDQKYGVPVQNIFISGAARMIFSGVLDRYPRLKVVSVENEVGWIPFWLDKCDKAYKRHRHSEKVPMTKLPSEYFAEQIYATFFNDHVGGKMFSWFGVDNCMWSNDYPHQNSTWPHSRDVIARDMADLPAASRDKLLNSNVRKLYKLNAPASLPKAA